MKYGIYFEKSRGNVELRKGMIDNVPLFYCAFPESWVKNALQEFQSSKESSIAEKKLFNDFLKSSKEQTDLLKKEYLHPKLKERLELFERSDKQR